MRKNQINSYLGNMTKLSKRKIRILIMSGQWHRFREKKFNAYKNPYIQCVHHFLDIFKRELLKKCKR